MSPTFHGLSTSLPLVAESAIPPTHSVGKSLNEFSGCYWKEVSYGHMNVQFPGLSSRLLFYFPRDRGFPTSRRSPTSLTSCVITTRSARVRLPADAAYLPCAALDLEGILEERHACTLPARRASSAPLQTP